MFKTRILTDIKKSAYSTRVKVKPLIREYTLRVLTIICYYNKVLI